MKHPVSSGLLLWLVCAVFLTSCGKKEDQEQTSALDKLKQAAEQTTKAAESMQKSMTSDREPVPPVSFKVLMEFLPKAVEGLTTGKPEGETTTMNEWSFAFAKNSYESADGSASARVEIYDYAFISLMYAPYQILLNMNYKQESSRGYQRSIKIADNPAFLKWEEESKQAEATVLVGERFIVKCETHGLPEGLAKKVIENIDLKKLSIQTAS